MNEKNITKTKKMMKIFTERPGKARTVEDNPVGMTQTGLAATDPLR